ncbi:sigma-E factor negative regulatory protein [Luteimonas arsenica]|uniref:sigma-E factor negative regulatory protein n=1 Tax=Luteimonas arsenica TaxID=1586242 RepID=UPI001404C548|nr:sigma-E factor negative regulatory protein [Luteimonas arsenica]
MKMTQEHDDIDIDFEPAPPDKLYAHNRRQLSAMLDGELSPDQARFMLRRLQHDAELAACWERWQVCGDVLRGRGHALLPADFSRRVAAAIAVPGPASAATAVEATRAGRQDALQRPHRLLRWGGGALAASVALVALFMARQLPDAQSPERVEAASAMSAAPVLVESGPTNVLADAGDVAMPATTPPDPAPQPADGGGVAPGLLAAAAPVVIAAAEVPRRTGERGSTRSQSQRAALRRTQATAEAPARVAVAAAPPRPAIQAIPAPAPAAVAAASSDLPALAGVPAGAVDGDALFGALPAAASRPWPRAVLPGLTRSSQPFAAGYGLPQSEAFAPFQPRLEAGGAAVPRPDAPAGHVPVQGAAAGDAGDSAGLRPDPSGTR